ncbi:DUF3050 domain-containing protein [Aquimarina hainanensis]|uniref:DUF3050 domain-containing protein n=1 Tax=Aquimarina hainanensis TaxID=1578017 RepID=A0ABW5N5T2_9FLAO|nr:DUF3050 domain-containing protein [Aquimarina sp. TRL1]QKX03926.1 DUF3050 domain-containing protein [Aquimarina sp. TRL1]
MINKVLQTLDPLREQLTAHPLYTSVKDLEDIRLFTEHHVYAVWDFMSLLKGLQIHLTCTRVPWVPSDNPVTRRFINEIVHGEESDIDATGTPMSHYEMYLEAMEEINADTVQITRFIREIEAGETVTNALRKVRADVVVQDFVTFTFDVLATKKPHVIAAVFTFGREDLIPDMFIGIVKGLEQSNNTSIGKLIYYLERHIELDGDEHGPISLKMVEELCGDDEEKWNEAIHYSRIALEKRIALWDQINHSFNGKTLETLA